MAAEATRMPFWVHQAIEYLLGALLVLQALTLERATVPLLAALAVVFLAATADGPLGAFRWVPRPVHRVLDLAAAGVFGAVALLWRDEAGPFGSVLVAGAAAVLVVLVIRTDYRTRRAPTRSSARGAAVSSKAETYGKAAGRAVGKGVNVLRGRGGPR